MNKKILYILILITGILVTSVMTGPVSAQIAPEISYPVAELGKCADKTACKVYCDKSENVDACLSFAEKNNLMSGEEIKVAKNFKKTGMTGPGGCKGKNECKTYCSNPDHMDECVTFAEKNGMMSGEQLNEAKKVKAAIAKGIKPPACGGKETCDAYCSSSEHVEECVTFGEAAGIISKEKADKIKSGKGGKGQGQGGDRQGPNGQQGDPRKQQGQDKQGPGDKRKGPGGQGGQDQGNGKQRPPQGQRQGQGDSGGQQDPEGPDGQNQGGSENGGQPPATN